MNVYDDRPFLERISVFDMFVDPDARHPKEMAWIAQRIWRPIQDVQVDSRYLPAARKKVSATRLDPLVRTGTATPARAKQPDRGVEVVLRGRSSSTTSSGARCARSPSTPTTPTTSPGS